MKFRTKRIYEAPARQDGYRVLVDRLWPRGIRKVDAAVDDWAKSLAPSTELRRWFAHDPEKWPEFQKRYRQELAATKGAVVELLERSPHQTITLLFAVQDTVHNNAVVLKDFLAQEVLPTTKPETET